MATPLPVPDPPSSTLPQLFGLIPTSYPPITIPTSAPTPTSLLYTLPAPTPRPYNHIVVFILPGITLPPNSAAAVYMQLPNQGFKFLGAVGEGKESAVFKVRGLGGAGAGTGGGGLAGGEVDMDAPSPTSSGEIILGISIESADAVASQMALLSSQTQTQSQSQSPLSNTSNPSQALVLAKPPAKKPDTLLLAQRIIKNAFNFLASFSGNAPGGVEVVPLRAFEEWWRKFEGRVRSDPGFLEREDGD